MVSSFLLTIINYAYRVHAFLLGGLVAIILSPRPRSSCESCQGHGTQAPGVSRAIPWYVPLGEEEWAEDSSDPDLFTPFQGHGMTFSTPIEMQPVWGTPDEGSTFATNAEDRTKVNEDSPPITAKQDSSYGLEPLSPTATYSTPNTTPLLQPQNCDIFTPPSQRGHGGGGLSSNAAPGGVSRPRLSSPRTVTSPIISKEEFTRIMETSPHARKFVHSLAMRMVAESERRREAVTRAGFF
ncbi:hypothetical protein DFP72DRAFT_1044772 [Ephemerocybe angulata]|uniref:Uncharacterized protein n=1 Tax=Ephemerocybe angulata TaxID=980116 RepID=A0A8H6I2C5_9AGAR|nr:hypothetical protein DFP72DRAFT_1044772 [Tulosesus angulatus]